MQFRRESLLLQGFAMLHQHATIIAKLETLRLRQAFNSFYESVQLSRRMTLFSERQEVRALQKALSCLRAESKEKKSKLKLLKLALRSFRIGLVQQRRQEQMIVSHFRAQWNGSTLSKAFRSLKAGIRVEKFDTIIRRRVEKTQTRCLLALKVNAEHCRRHTAKKLVKYLSKSGQFAFSQQTFNLFRAPNACHDLGLAPRDTE